LVTLVDWIPNLSVVLLDFATPAQVLARDHHNFGILCQQFSKCRLVVAIYIVDEIRHNLADRLFVFGVPSCVWQTKKV